MISDGYVLTRFSYLLLTKHDKHVYCNIYLIDLQGDGQSPPKYFGTLINI
jgi:hypothetical protein